MRLDYGEGEFLCYYPVSPCYCTGERDMRDEGRDGGMRSRIIHVQGICLPSAGLVGWARRGGVAFLETK